CSSSSRPRPARSSCATGAAASASGSMPRTASAAKASTCGRRSISCRGEADAMMGSTRMDDPTVVEVKKGRAEEPALLGARYRPIALLGSGGMGSVYLTRDMQLDELVAVKVLRSDLGASMLERFRDEVRLARRVTSPCVARTHDLAEHEGRFFVTMQYVEGETLSALI